jgi:hypothetical protein
MKKATLTLALFLGILFFSSSSIVHSDLIEPGYRGITITYQIQNINYFSDYSFISVGSAMGSMCPVYTISSNGIIPNYYKFCMISVYAIKKSTITNQKLDNITQEDLTVLLSNPNNKKVISNIHTYTTVPKASLQKDYTKYYNIDLNKVIDAETEISSIQKNNNVSVILLFLFNIIIEFIIIYLFIKSKALNVFLVVLLLNIITWPIANFIFSPQSFSYFIIIEFGVFIVEALGLKFLLKLEYNRAFLISFCANFATALIGFLISFFKIF